MEPYILTIAIPTYNREHLLKRLLVSISKQILPEIEVIVYDNASTDNTKTMVKSFHFVNYKMNNVNLGADNNFLNCYKNANGKYIWLLGSDDYLCDDALATIITFLKSNDDSLIFLNHNFFLGSYCSENIINSFFGCNRREYERIYDRNVFMNKVKYQLTFMSAFLIRNTSFQSVKNPEKYIGTSFIHTCIAFEGTKSLSSSFGIIYYPCVSQDITPTNSEFCDNYELLFQTFGSKTKFVFCDVAPKFSYSKVLMKKIYIRRYLKQNILLYMQAKIAGKPLDAFWKYVFPAMKEFSLFWVVALPIIMMPKVLYKLLYRVRPFFRKKKYAE